MDRSELRRLAEAAKMVTCIIDRRGDMGAFKQVCTPSAIIELLNKLEAAEKVCEAVQKLSDLYNGEIDTIHEQLYNRWRELDDALDKWQGVK